MNNSNRSINFFDLTIFSNRMTDLLTLILPRTSSGSAKNDALCTIFTPNSEQIVLSEKQPSFKHTLQQGDILIPDGVGLITAQKVLKCFGKSDQLFKERITGVDLSQELLKYGSENNQKMLVLGGKDLDKGTNKAIRVHKINIKNVEQLAQKNPNNSRHDNYTQKIEIYWLEGYADIHQVAEEEEKFVIQTIKTLKPSMVFVALGAPYQEQWILAHQELLAANQTRVALVVGGAFDIIVGKLTRAPHLIRLLGLEWLFRLIQEPHRWKRQLQLIAFIGLVGKKLTKKN